MSSKFLNFELCSYLVQACLTFVVTVSLVFGLVYVENYWILLCLILWSNLYVSIQVRVGVKCMRVIEYLYAAIFCSVGWFEKKLIVVSVLVGLWCTSISILESFLTSR